MQHEQFSDLVRSNFKIKRETEKETDRNELGCSSVERPWVYSPELPQVHTNTHTHPIVSTGQECRPKRTWQAPRRVSWLPRSLPVEA